jgi:hypothetical protein
MQKLAFFLIAAGILVLIGWGVKGFFLATDIPIWIRIAIGAIGAGVLILVGIVVKDRLSKQGKEDFKEVDK